MSTTHPSSTSVESNFLAIPAKVAAGLIVSQRRARAIYKDGKGDGISYRYAKSEDVIDEGRQALNDGGLALMQAGVELHLLDQGEQTDRSDEKQEREKSRLRAFLRIDYVLVHESGDAYPFEREWPCIVQKGRPLDKAEGGALTTALAYTYRDLLGIPRDDELAAMDRRNDAPDKPEKRDDVADRDTKPDNVQRDTKPANDSKADDAAPESKPVVPRDTEHPFRRLLPLIQSRTLKPDILVSEIDRADCTDDERKALDLVSVAFRTQAEKDFLSLASKIRTSFPKNDVGDRLRDWTLKAIEPAWKELSTPPADPTRAA